jgi:hypothetical protein
MNLPRSFAWIALGFAACAPAPTTPPSPVLESDSAPVTSTRTIAPTGGSDAKSDGTPKDTAASDVGDGSTADATSAQTQFLVLRVGSPTSSLTGTTTFATFIEFRNISDGSLASTLPVSTAATGGMYPLTLVGLAGEGALSLSYMGHYVSFAGYDVPITSPAAGVTGATIGSVSVTNGVYKVDTAVVDTNTTGGFGKIWSAVRYGSEFWVLSERGVDFMDTSASPVTPTRFTVSPTVGELQIVDGLLYSTDSPGGIWSAGSTLPTGGAAGSPVWTQYVPEAQTGATIDGFVFVTMAGTVPTRMYLADWESGLERWNYVGGSWVRSATIYSQQGVRHVTGFVQNDGVTVTLIATTQNGGAILGFEDDGVSPTLTPSWTQTSSSVNQEQYLGVSLLPQ